ncbi:MAG: nitrite/sulfite reductase [Deltaproteobacteria bacterium]|nr:nitrite/sulfite reductase [Deltaproteobacteria bacterium]MDQ3295160.1 nitrite/sulfite reductase [Myxococcota bacterium]
MYQYDDHDRRIIIERAQQFRGQVARRLSGEITEEEFKPLRLQNGLYMQLHAYMLRVAIPYGLLSSTQVRRLADIARKYDRGYAHLTTRQNIQYNWPKLGDVPSILDDLADVEMHAVQTSGNCVRNITSDPFAGIAPDELEDPRPYCEIMRQWSTFHPEFANLPRKFKIAVTGTPGEDRAAVRFHDIGIRIVENAAKERGFEVLVGGGMGRTPHIGAVIREFLPKRHLLSYMESILRVYNLHGRRDNKFKARIKILVVALGVEEFRRRVEEDWEATKTPELELPDAEVARVTKFFAPPAYEKLPASADQLTALSLGRDRELGNWIKNNVVGHKVPGYSAVVISVKMPGVPPGDVSDTQLDAIAGVADRYSFGHVVVTHTQNLVLPDVKTSDLAKLHAELVELDLGKANVGKLTDVITCPGLDYCDLANARSIPLSLEIAERFDRIDYLNDVGDVSIKISGCINACGHHHVGNIGILGIDKRGEEFYQLMLGGSPGNDASIGKILGAALPQDAIVDAVEKVLDRYLVVRESADERFLDTVRRVGFEPFRQAVYGDALFGAAAEKGAE